MPQAADLVPRLEWTNVYSVGVGFIDDDHKKLVQLISDLNEASGKGKGKEVVGSVLMELVEYTDGHFKREEAAMKRYLYPEYVQHKKIHDELMKKVGDLLEKHKAGNVFVTIEVMQFLQNWLIQHIIGTDKKLGAFLQTKGVK